MTKTCPGCGADAPAEARFCRLCGTGLRTTTGGDPGSETVSPLAATAPLAEQRAITSELDSNSLHFSTPPTPPLHPDAPTLLATPPRNEVRADEPDEITIPVVRPAGTLTSGVSATAPAEVVSPPFAPVAPEPATSASPSFVAASEARQPPEHRALRVWLVAALLGSLLLTCIVGAGAWYWWRIRPQPSAPTADANAPVVAAPADAQQQAQAKIAEAQGLLAAGNPVAATARLREAVALDPANAEAHRQLAGLLLESGARETAIAELRAVTQLEPNDKDAWRQLADAQFAAGQYADAADSYHTLMAVSSEASADDRLQLAYADALRLAGRTDDARAVYRRLAASPLVDVARTSRQRLAEASAPPPPNQTASASTRSNSTTEINNVPPAPASHAPAPTPPEPNTPAPPAPALSSADHYQRGVELWPANRAAAANEFRAAAGAGNADAYYYLGLSLAEGRDPHTLGRAELVAALEYFQRARNGRFGAQARRYEDQLGQEFDRRRAKQ